MAFNSSGGRLGHGNVGSVFFVHLNSTVGDVGWGSKEFVLKLSIIFTNNLSLLLREGEEGSFFLFGHSLESLKSVLNFSLDHRKDDIVLIGHFSGSDT